MSQKLGISTYAYFGAIRDANQRKSPLRTALNLLDKASNLGLEVLQICENLPLQNWAKTDLEDLKEAAQEKGIDLEVGARGLDIQNLLDYLEITHLLDAHILRFNPWSGEGNQSKLTIDQLDRVVTQLLPACCMHGITLAIENYFELKDRDLAKYIHQLNDDHVGACLDTANSVGQLENPLTTAEWLAPYVVSLHLKDFIVTKPVNGYIISGAPLGQGRLDAPAIMELVAKTGRQPNVLLELWIDLTENLETTLRIEELWLQQSVDYARNQLGIQAKRPESYL